MGRRKKDRKNRLYKINWGKGVGKEREHHSFAF